MAYIDQTQTKKEIEDAIRGNSVSNIAPTKVSDNVQLVLNVNPKDYRRVNVIKRVSAAGTVYTTPLDKDFFYVGSSMTGDLTTASTAVGMTMSIFPKGEASVVVNASNFRTTAILDTAYSVSTVMLPNAILLERGTAIVFSASNTTSRSATIFGYTVEL